jgi:hypothetical protein
MSTVRPSRAPSHDPGPFTDVRTVIIVLIALALSLGAGLTTAAVMTTAGAGQAAVIIGALSATGSAMAVMVALLHRLIGK